jgi:hypothetical protein
VNAATAYNDAAAAYNSTYGPSLTVPTVTGIFPFLWTGAGIVGTRDIPALKARYQQIGGAIKPERTSPLMAVDVPAPNQSFTTTITVSGWAIDRGALAGPGVDWVDVHARPVNDPNNRRYVGPATLSYSRPDVATYYGFQSQYSGFALSAPLPPGTYDLEIYARSSVTHTFNNVIVRRILVN